jgi:NAD(P)-dependent dehydrogenase (short-subunit alcohol dehydrogenase family)
LEHLVAPANSQPVNRSDLESLRHKNVLVTGASGIVGRKVISELSRLGNKPYALSRTPQSDEHAHWIVADSYKPHDAIDLQSGKSLLTVNNLATTTCPVGACF